MELRQLRYFVALAEELHFGRAARRVHVSQPPLSQQIRALEEELGARLFDRTSRRVLLTPEGEAFLEDVRGVLRGLEEAVDRVRGVAQGERGRLRVGFVGSAVSTRFPAGVAAFRERHPAVRLELRESGTLVQRRAIAEGRLDVGLFRNLGETPDDLTTEPFLHDSYILALPERHPLARRDSVNLADLRDVPLVMYPRPVFPAAYDAIIEACRSVGFSPRIGQEAVSIGTQKALVAAGTGVAIVPGATRREPREGVAYRTIIGPLPDIRLDLAWRKGRDDALLRAFLDAVRPFGVALDL